MVCGFLAGSFPKANAVSDLPDADEKLASFIGGLRPQSLRSFESISRTGMRAESFLALSHHAESLTTLKMNLQTESMQYLGLLKNCTALETLQLEDAGRVTDLEKTQNDVFSEVVQWLRNCTKLRSLSISKFASAANLVVPLLLEESIRLRSLEISNYVVKDNRSFHQALSCHEDLRSLFLAGDAEGMFRDDADIMLDSLCSLKNLRELELRGVSDYLNEDHITTLAANLTQLEDLYITGNQVTDRVLPRVAGLKSLKSITFGAMSLFSLEGLLEFIDGLGPGNSGIEVYVAMAEPQTTNHYRPLSEDEQSLIRDQLASKVDGRFEYVLYRDPDVESFGDSDSD